MRMAEIGDVRAAEVARLAHDSRTRSSSTTTSTGRSSGATTTSASYAARAPGGPRRPPPREARLPAEDGGAGRPLLGRSGEQAAAARERDALPRGGRVAEGDPDAREVGRPEGRAAEGGRAAAVPGGLGDRAERAALPRADEGPRTRLADPREAAPPPQPQARRVVGLAAAGRPHHPRA